MPPKRPGSTWSWWRSQPSRCRYSEICPVSTGSIRMIQANIPGKLQKTDSHLQEPDRESSAIFQNIEDNETLSYRVCAFSLFCASRQPFETLAKAGHPGYMRRFSWYRGWSHASHYSSSF